LEGTNLVINTEQDYQAIFNGTIVLNNGKLQNSREDFIFNNKQHKILIYVCLKKVSCCRFKGSITVVSRVNLCSHDICTNGVFGDYD